jgi:phage gp36-like protein
VTYATRQDIETLRGARFLETLLPLDVDADVAVGLAIEAAQAQIDPYLRKRYVLPIAVVPPILKQCAIDLACWQLAPAADRMSDEIEKRAKLRLDFLKDVASGKAEIAELETVGGGAGTDLDASSGSGAAFSAEPRRWSGDIL